MTSEQVKKQLEKVIRHRNCTGCGACVLFSGGTSRMTGTSRGPVPLLDNALFSEEALQACPGIGIHYPELYDRHHGSQPDNYLHGMVQRVRIGYAADEKIRRRAASGGVITSVLLYLLKEKLVDGVVCVRQGLPSPSEASAVIARTAGEITDAMQSVYIPVSLLDKLSEFKPGERYALVGLPEQTATLRKLQQMGHPAAQQVRYVLGPYTGTALYPAAIRAFLRSKHVRSDDPVTSLKWREGEWPGYLEIRTASGRVLQSKKIYYNFLIPFYVTHTSLRSMDFVNEFADLAVGDAWSPRYEKEGKGFSVFVTRSEEMEKIVSAMTKGGLPEAEENRTEEVPEEGMPEEGIPVESIRAEEVPTEEMSAEKVPTEGIRAEEVPEEEAVAMHGHMLDFKKRGGYLRNRMRSFFGHPVPDYGYRPVRIGASRWLTELVISGIFLLAGNRFSRWLMTLVPEQIMGPVFDFMRLRWKKASKPVKRKGLHNYRIEINDRS